MPTLDEKRAVLSAVTRKLLHTLGPDLEFLKQHGFGVTIFAFDFGDAGAIAYISTSERAAMIEAVRVWLAQQEAGLETEPRGERAKS
jgi:hypothetical protein